MCSTVSCLCKTVQLVLRNVIAIRFICVLRAFTVNFHPFQSNAKLLIMFQYCCCSCVLVSRRNEFMRATHFFPFNICFLFTSFFFLCICKCQVSNIIVCIMPTDIGKKKKNIHLKEKKLTHSRFESCKERKHCCLFRRKM